MSSSISLTASTAITADAATSIPFAFEAPALTAVEEAQAIEIYRKNYCGYCHALAIADTHGTFGPTHDHVGAEAATRVHEERYHGAATTAAEYLLESLTDPQRFLVDGYQLTNHHMPAFTHLSQADLDLLVRLLLQQQ